MLSPVTSDQHRVTYEGRVLPRPGEEIVDQGLAFDIGTLMSRRQTLRALGLGAASLGLVACGGSDSGSSTATTSKTTTSKTTTSKTTTSKTTSSGASTSATAPTEEIPEETAGPYPGDGSNGPDVLEQSGVVRSDIRSSFGDATGTAEGVPMTLELSIFKEGGTPYEGVAVYVWHCTRDGEYSMYSQNITNENYLRGVQIADASGKVTFSSIFPACYSGRWPHIHFEVYPDQASITDASNAIATSQVALPQDACETVYATSGYEASVNNLSQISLATDNVFGNDSGVHQLATVTGDVTNGLTVALSALVT
jgi:protocatechuate 3,4-dioxygenase beta subunit